MDDKFREMWSVNRQKGVKRFVFSYTFTAAVFALLGLTIAKFFLPLATPQLIWGILGFALVGTIGGLSLWNHYEKEYQQRIPK